MSHSPNSCKSSCIRLDDCLEQMWYINVNIFPLMWSDNSLIAMNLTSTTKQENRIIWLAWPKNIMDPLDFQRMPGGGGFLNTGGSLCWSFALQLGILGQLQLCIELHLGGLFLNTSSWELLGLLRNSRIIEKLQEVKQQRHLKPHQEKTKSKPFWIL